MGKEIRMILIVIGILGVCILLFQGIDLAQAKDPDYPIKPVSLNIHIGPGSAADTTVRVLIEGANKYFGQPFIPINKPGGGGIVSAMSVMSAKPDGYTLGTFAGSAIFIFPHSEECPYKDLSGFTLIVNYGRFLFPVFVRDDAPWKTWGEFIEWARRNPRGAKIGTTSARSMAPMGIALWVAEQKEKVEFSYLVYKGGGEITSALLGGHINVDASSIDPARVAYLKEGKIRILAYLCAEKIPGYENAPSFRELYGFVPPNLMGVWGPKDLPGYVLESPRQEPATAATILIPNLSVSLPVRRAKILWMMA